MTGTIQVTDGERVLREAIIAAAQRLNRVGLTHGSTGNVSVRIAGGFLITPTGMPYAALAAGDIVRLGADGRVGPGQLAPSSEWRFHKDIYAARADAGAIVHTHSPYATAIACTRRPIPAFHYMVAAAGADTIPCVPYATFGSQDLSGHVVAGLGRARACLLANHGQVATGADLEAAMALAETVEELARQYWLTLAAGGPVLLDAAEMQIVLDKFAGYGRQDHGGH